MLEIFYQEDLVLLNHSRHHVIKWSPEKSKSFLDYIPLPQWVYATKWLLKRGHACLYMACHVRHTVTFLFPKNSGLNIQTCACQMNGIFHQSRPISFHSRLGTFPAKIYPQNWRVIIKWGKQLHAKKFNTHSRLFWANSSLTFTWPTQTSFSWNKEKLANSSRGRFGKPDEYLQENTNDHSTVFQQIRS